MCIPKAPEPQKAFLPPAPAPFLEQDTPRAATGRDEETKTARKRRGTRRYGQPLQIGGVSTPATSNNVSLGGM